MLKDEEIKEIINLELPPILNKLEVIRRFIFDMKDKDVGNISYRPGALVVAYGQFLLEEVAIELAYHSAKNFYINKFNK